MKKKILVTGSAGFIGFSVCLKLLESGFNIVGIDNHNNYYDQKLKLGRLKILKKFSNYVHYRFDICDKSRLKKVFKYNNFDKVIHLAAQAGVRYSIEKPEAYINSNILGFFNILENCRYTKINHLVYASTSSIYGANTKIPFSESSSANHPLSLYAATKKSNELMAHSYSHLFKLPTSGLRFFTVYGPWGRPDMALFKFTKLILEGKKINVFNYGKHVRDFTYIDDIVSGILKVLKNPPKGNKKWNSNKPDPANSIDPWCVYNIGNNKPINLMHYIKVIEQTLSKKAKINFLPLQKGDVPSTRANISLLSKKFKFKPKVSINIGIKKFIDWYIGFYRK